MNPVIRLPDNHDTKFTCLPQHRQECSVSRHVKRKNIFLLILIAAGIITLFPFASTTQAGAGVAKKEITIGEYFDGEEFTYTIGFWWFKNVALGKIGIHKKKDGLYEITLTAETMGFIGFITGYRKDIYRAYTEEIEKGRRFRTKRFETIIKMGGMTKESYAEVDYQRRAYHWKSWKDGKEEREVTEPIPPGMFYDDPLTGFYNFRFGAYGQIKEGKEFHVPTFPSKGVSTIYVRVATDKEKAERINPDPALVSYLADIVIAKELFGSQTGKVEVRFNKELIPVQAIAKDLILFGDVRGTLIEMTTSMGFMKEQAKTGKP
ncbi:MAG: DUF3108 domain-containing protein [Deltaproteobacteria bacterium]|nr:DUF3108 domain-containing protein [Deltaproteobacteria bacterium]